MIELLSDKHTAMAGNTKEAIAAGLVDTVAPHGWVAAAIVRSVREGVA